jgi:hypothetical protein
MDALLAFAASLLSLRLASRLLARWRSTRRLELALWATALGAYALAAAALAWGTAHGWDVRAFRLYYLFGALATAPLLGTGSLALTGRRRALPLALVYAGFATGIAIAMPVHGDFAGTAVPAAQDHLAFVPARLVAVVANTLGTLAVVAVAAAGFRRRPLGNALIVAGVGVTAVGSALGGLGAAGLAATLAAGVALLYAGFVAPATWSGLPLPQKAKGSQLP